MSCLHIRLLDCSVATFHEIQTTLRTKTFGRKNFGLPKVFPSENFRFCAVLLKSLKTFKNIVGLIKQQQKIYRVFKLNTKILFLIWTNKHYISTFVHLRISYV